MLLRGMLGLHEAGVSDDYIIVGVICKCVGVCSMYVTQAKMSPLTSCPIPTRLTELQ